MIRAKGNTRGQDSRTFKESRLMVQNFRLFADTALSDRRYSTVLATALFVALKPHACGMLLY